MKTAHQVCRDRVKSSARWLRATPKTSLALRLALIVCLGWASLSSARSIQRWLNPTARGVPASRASLTPAVTPADALLESVEAEGAWTIAGMPWQVQVESTESEEAAVRWIDRREPPSAVDKATGADGAAFAPLLKQLGAHQSETAGGAAYRSDAQGWKLRARLQRQSGSERLVSVRLAMQSEGRHWQLFALTPAPESGVPEQAGDLLPLGAEARRLASRRGDDGVLQCQVLQIRRSEAALLAEWRRAGWSLHSAGPAPGDELHGWLCVGDRYSVQAWCWQDAANAGRNLLLVRL